MTTKSNTTRARVITTTLNDDATVMTFNVAGAGTFAIGLNDLSDDIRNAAMWHGLKQKVSDAAAISVNDDGTPATPADKFAAMQSVADNLRNGDWSKRGSGDGEAPVSGLILRAFQRWAELTATANGATAPADLAARVKAKYDAMTRADQLALRKLPANGAIPSMADIMAGMKPAPKSTPDASAMLADLGI